MENKVLSANLLAVKSYDGELYERILRINDTKSIFELIQNSSGEYNLVYNSTILHSAQNATDEAKKIADNIADLDNKNSIRVIYGLGLGYLADEFIRRAKGTVIIYEPDVELIRTVLEIVEFEKNLSKNNVILCSNMQKLLEWIDNLSDKETKITVSFLTSYLNLFKADIYRTAQIVERTRGEKQANLNTINKVAGAAVLNTLNKIDDIIKTPLVAHFKDLYKGKTAIIASAGPSLENCIETLKQNRDKFILFAAGPALRLLDKNNIKPDFLCIIEILNTQGQIEGIDLSSVNLIFEPFSNTYLWDLNVKNKFLFFSKDNFLNDWLANILEIDISKQKSVGTVSYCALSSAKIMGFEKIILCGQNLAFSDGKCYAKGSTYEDLECILNPDTKKYEIVAKNYENYKTKLLGSKKINAARADYYVKNYIKKLNKTLYSVMGQNNEILPTQACYAIFIKHFEEFAANNKGIKYINSSIGGAQINGFENMPLDEALSGSTPISNVEIHISDFSYNAEKIKKAKEDIVLLLKRVKEYIQPLFVYQDEILKEISRRKAVTKNTQKYEEKITLLLNEFTQKFYKDPVIYYLCTAITNIIFTIIKEKTSDIKQYEASAKRTAFHINNLNNRIQSGIKALSDK